MSLPLLCTFLPLATAPVEPPGWMVEAGFWIAVAALLGLAAIAAGVWTLVSSMHQLRAQEKRLALLGEIEAHVARMSAQREDLDLRRVEHVLIDIRDGLKRLEERVLEAQARRSQPEPATSDLMIPAPPQTLVERITNRMLVQGFAQVQVLTPEGEVDALHQSDGEVVGEARRNGVLYKGRVRLRSGRIDGVDMNPAYSVFP